jgi:hypothetical protein
MTLAADDILPLVATLTPHERMRLIGLIAPPQGADKSVYEAQPPSQDEFSSHEEALAWEAGGWEEFGEAR